MADGSQWVSFDVDDNDDKKQPPLIEKPSEKREFLSSEAYISVLGKYLIQILINNRASFGESISQWYIRQNHCNIQSLRI